MFDKISKGGDNAKKESTEQSQSLYDKQKKLA